MEVKENKEEKAKEPMKEILDQKDKEEKSEKNQKKESSKEQHLVATASTTTSTTTTTTAIAKNTNTSSTTAVFTTTPLNYDYCHGHVREGTFRNAYGAWTRTDGGSFRCSCEDHFLDVTTTLKASLRMPDAVFEQILLGYVDPGDYMRCLKVLVGPSDEVTIPVDCPVEFDQQTDWNKMREKLSNLICQNESEQWPQYDVDEGIIQVKIDLLNKQDTRGWTLLGVETVHDLKKKFKMFIEPLINKIFKEAAKEERSRAKEERARKRQRKDNKQQPELHQPLIQEQKQQQVVIQNFVKGLVKSSKPLVAEVLRTVWSWRTGESRKEMHPFKFIAPVCKNVKDFGHKWSVLTWESKKGPQEVPTVTYYDTVGLIHDKCVKYFSLYAEWDELYNFAAHLSDNDMDENLCMAVYNSAIKHALWNLKGQPILKVGLETAYLTTLTGAMVPLPSPPVYRLIAPNIVQVKTVKETGVYCTAIIHLLTSACSTLDRLKDDQGPDLRRRLVFEVINNLLYDPDANWSTRARYPRRALTSPTTPVYRYLSLFCSL